jgi:hypothetical protein
MIVPLVIALLGLPAVVEAQRPVLEARVGYAWHGSARCHYVTRKRGLAAGIEARTRGAWIASGALDLMLGDWSWGCLDIGLPEFDYEGQLVSLWGESGAGVRIKVEVGHTLVVGPFRWALTAGGGLFPTYIDYGPDRSDFSWQPWYGGTLTTRLPGSGAGVQVELGGHRLTQRYYAVDTGALVDEIHSWKPSVRLGMTFPL